MMVRMDGSDTGKSRITCHIDHAHPLPTIPLLINAVCRTLTIDLAAAVCRHHPHVVRAANRTDDGRDNILRLIA